MNFKFVPFFPPHVTSYFGSGLAPCGVGLPALVHAQDTLPAKCGGVITAHLKKQCMNSRHVTMFKIKTRLCININELSPGRCD